jgi:hypothetical protein
VARAAGRFAPVLHRQDGGHHRGAGGGRVLEAGSHQELRAAGGRYAELFELQAAGYR